MDNQETPQECWDRFWKGLLVLPDGSIDVEQLKKELVDFSVLIRNIPAVYMGVTGGMVSNLDQQIAALEIDNPEVYPYRYSTVAYMDVHAYNDEQHELMCRKIAVLLSTLDFVKNVSCSEV